MANDLNKMDYKAEFLRGWPNGSALELDRYELNTGVNVEAGDLVTVNNSGKLIKVAASAAAAFAGIVVKGNLDDKSVAKIGRPIVLWGNYVVRTQKFTGSIANGAGVVADDGIFIDAGANTPMGYCLQTIVGTGGEPNSIVVVVK
jgi:hypothetical protein